MFFISAFRTKALMNQPLRGSNRTAQGTSTVSLSPKAIGLARCHPDSGQKPVNPVNPV
jgi:hypothetical protein